MPTLEIVPDTTNNTNWTPSAGSGGNSYQLLDEGSGAIDESDYISATANGKIATFELTAPGVDLSSATISQVKVSVRAKGNSATGADVAIGLGAPTGPQTTYAFTTGLGSSYSNYSASWTENPFSSAAWTSGDIDELEATVKSVVLGRSKEVFVATIWVQVTYSFGYGEDIAGIDSGDISTVSGVATADISKVNGV